MNKLTFRDRSPAGWILPMVFLVGSMQPASGQPIAAVFDNTPHQKEQANQISLKQALNQLESKFQVSFGYESSLIERLTVENRRYEQYNNVETAISKLLTPFKLTFIKVNNRVFVIRPKADQKSFGKSEASLSNDLALGTDYSVLQPAVITNYSVNQIQATVTGTIKDAATGEPLPGVTVLEKGTGNGTTSDVQGKYSLNVANENSVLTFSFIGYEPRDIKVNNQTVINVSLTTDARALSEVVVVGYGTQKTRDVTGSIASVKAEQITQTPVLSLDQALQGRAAGVQVMQSNGAPGGAVQVQIRGVNSTNAGVANQPLYIVDGIPLYDNGLESAPGAGNAGSPQNNTGSPLATINPNDIESIDILKDAASTAIYGARAANGVVVITTKSGKAGKTQFNVDYYYGVQQMQKQWDVLNATEGMMLRNEAFLNTHSDITRNINPEMFNPFTFSSSPKFQNTEWQDVLFRTAGIQDFNLSASGGTEKVRFAASGNYFDQQGIFLNTYSKRVSGRFNLDVNATDKLKFGMRNSLAGQWGNNVTDGNPFQGTVINAILVPTYNQAYFPDGSFWGPVTQSGLWETRNPAFEAEKFTRNINRNRAISNVFAEYEIITGLRFRSAAGIDYTTIDQKYVNPAIFRGPFFINSGPDLPGNNTSRVRVNGGNTLNWVATQSLSYDKVFNEAHSVAATVVFEAQQFTTKSFTGGGEGSLNPELVLVGTNNNNVLSFGEGFSQQGLVSQLVRVNYGFKDRYLFQGNVRRDGSSRFGPANKYGIFPGASAAWRISEESFMQGLTFLSDLKLRTSWGIVGNQEIGDFRYASRIGGLTQFFGNTQVQAAAATGLANETLKWEENESIDFGVDASFLEGRINVVADYFVKNAKNLLVAIPIPNFSGFGSQTVNLGTIRNKGFEFGINTQNLTGALKWSTDFNITTINNEVIDLGRNPAGGVNEFFGISTFTTSGPHNLTRAGEPIGAFYGLKTDGIFQTQEEVNNAPTLEGTALTGIVRKPGDVRYVDTNGDGKISTSGGVDDDRVFLGSPFAKYYGGLSNNFSYKNFSLNIFANFNVGNKIFNHARLMLEDFGDPAGNTNQLNRWQGPGSTNEFPRMTLGGASGYNRVISDRWIEDGSFLRVRNITLGYNIPPALVGKAKMRSARIYTSVNNAFTFTKYSGWDPEVNSTGSNVLTGGTDLGGYPVARSFILGVNIGF